MLGRPRCQSVTHMSHIFTLHSPTRAYCCRLPGFVRCTGFSSISSADSETMSGNSAVIEKTNLSQGIEGSGARSEE